MFQDEVRLTNAHWLSVKPTHLSLLNVTSTHVLDAGRLEGEVDQKLVFG